MARDLRTETVPMPQHLLGCLWVLEDSQEPPGEPLPLVRALTAAGCWTGLAWVVALSWIQLFPKTRTLFRDGRRDVIGWLSTILCFWPQVII